MKTKEYTDKILGELKKIHAPDSVVKEWNAAKNSLDDFNSRDYYAPRVDIALGPFNIDKNLAVNNNKFERMVEIHKDLLEKLYSVSHVAEGHEYMSFQDFMSVLNKNPRCFIAIEIENTKDSKRAFGDILNASVMGKIGIVLPIGGDKYQLFYRLKRYFNYLKQVGKLEGNFKNVLIIEGTKFLEVIQEHNNATR